MEKKYELVFCIVNAGFSDAVMYAARKAGAGGGTILKGRGTASPEIEAKYNITVQPEKEIVMIIVPEEIKDDVLRSIYDSAGLGSEGQSIAFSLPVERSLGLDTVNRKADEKDKGKDKEKASDRDKDGE